MKRFSTALTLATALALCVLTVQLPAQIPQPSGGSASSSGSAPSTTNVLVGDGAGGITDGGIAASALAPKASPALTGTPTAPTPATSSNDTTLPTTAYVTTAIANAVAAVNPSIAVQVASAAALPAVTYSNGTSGVGATLIQNSAAVLVVDGYTVALGDRLIIKNQASTFQNGVYTVTTLGTGVIPFVLTRASDFNSSSNISNSGLIPVDNNGTTLAKTGWYITSVVATMGTDAITFTQFAPSIATIPYKLTGSGTIDFASISDATCSANSSITVTGALTTDYGPIINLPAALRISGIFPQASVTASDTVSLQICNLTGAPVDPASASFGAMVLR